jgi:hypothetical protein
MVKATQIIHSFGKLAAPKLNVNKSEAILLGYK